MNRSPSNATDKKGCASLEELKELFLDPALKTNKNADNTKKKNKDKDSSSSAPDVEVGATVVKVNRFQTFTSK